MMIFSVIFIMKDILNPTLNSFTNFVKQHLDELEHPDLIKK